MAACHNSQSPSRSLSLDSRKYFVRGSGAWPIFDRLLSGGLALQFDQDHIEGLVANVLRQMNLGLIPDDVTGLPVEVLALAIREGEPALGVGQKHGHGIRMRMHRRF